RSDVIGNTARDKQVRQHIHDIIGLETVTDAQAQAFTRVFIDDGQKTDFCAVRQPVGHTFNAQSDLFLKRLKEAGKYNQYTSEKPRIKHFKEFVRYDIAFTDITVSLLERFHAHVKNKLKLSERSAVNHLVTIRSVFSHAIKEGVVDAKYYPFGKGKVKIKFPESSKVGLNAEE